MPNVVLKLEVSPSPPIPFWKVYVAAKNPPLPPLVLNGPGPDFPPINPAGFFVWDQPLDVDGPTLSITLHISTADAALGAACRVTINTVVQDNVLICRGGGPDVEYNYSLPGPGSPVVLSPASAVIDSKNSGQP